MRDMLNTKMRSALLASVMLLPSTALAQTVAVSSPLSSLIPSGAPYNILIPAGTTAQRDASPVLGESRYNNSNGYNLTNIGAVFSGLETYLSARTFSGGGASSGWFPWLNSNYGPIDITQAPYWAPCNGTTDISATVQSAYGSGRDVFIPNTNLACVFGGILVNGYNNIISDNGQIKPAPGYPYMFKLTGGPTTGSFTSGQTACVPVITLPTAPNGWWCEANDLSHTADLFVQTASAAASCTVSGTTTSGDTIVFHAEGY